MPEIKYPWYSIAGAQDKLSQGDFILSCPIIIPPKSFDMPTQEVETYDVVVMSQSCDLLYDKIGLVLLCPFWEITDFEQRNDKFKDKTLKESLRRGNLPRYHLLNKCDMESFKYDYLIVDFSNVFSSHIEFLNDFVIKQGKRLRLLPPYREHLSQAFARFFMRVGLPVDIPQFR